MTEPKRKVLRDLQLSEISFVTQPAQSPALACIMKSDDPMVAQLVEKLSTTNGAHTFSEFLETEDREVKAWRAQEKVWPVVDALRNSVNSVVADSTLTGDEKLNRISIAAGEFVGAMQMRIHEVEAVLMKVFNPQTKESDSMTEHVKTIADLEAKIAKLAPLAEMSDVEKAYLSNLSGDAAATFVAADKLSRAVIVKAAAAADETVETDGQTIRKSVVGESVFAILKKQAADIKASAEAVAKAKDETLTVELKKRAGAELDKLPGDEDSKVALLKAVSALPEAVRGTFDAIVKAGNAALSGAFIERGVETGASVEKADKRSALIAKYRTEHPSVTIEQATVAVLSANPDLYPG